MRFWAVWRAAWMRTVTETKRYLFDTVSTLVTLYVIFLLLYAGATVVGGTVFRSAGSLEGLVVGYMVWVFAVSGYSDIAWDIANEAEMGTLEQLYLSPAGFAWVSGALTLARLVLNLALAAVMLLAMMLTTGRWLQLDLVSILPLLLVTVTASYGFGFVMGGLALVFKRIQSALQLLQFVFVAFIAAPLGRLPWLKYLPLALGNDLLREVMSHGVRLWELPAGDLALATLVGLGYLAIGLGVFGGCVRLARDRALLGHY